MQDMLRILTRRNFTANKNRNLIAVLAIMLCTTLFTSITTIGIGTAQSITLTFQIQKLSKSDGDFRFMDASQFETMRQAEWIAEAGLRMPVGYLSNARLHNIEFDVLDETQAELTFCMPSHGKTPKQANEIVASDKALRDLGAEPQIGGEVTITFSAHGKTYTMPMIISGWYEAYNDQLSVMWSAPAFRDANPDIFQYTYPEDHELAGTYWSDILAKNKTNLHDKMNDLACQLEDPTGSLQKPEHLSAVVNTVTNPTKDNDTLAMIAILLLLFLFCGYLLIYNIFDIAVMQEIRRFGLYRTIGMSRKQVKSLMNRQTLWLSCIGIPFGLLAGFLIGKATIPQIMDYFDTEYQNIAVDVSPSPLIFLGGSLLSALTIFISTRKPIKIAANTPPIEAFRYVESRAGKRASRKSCAFTSLARLAWSNLGRNKRRSAFIVTSLTLCIVLFNCVGTAASSMDIEKQTSYMMRTDFAIVNIVSTNNTKGFSHRSESLKEQTIADIAAQSGVTDGSVIYKNTAEDINITYGFPNAFLDETVVRDDNDLTFCFDEAYRCFGLGSDGRPLCNVYGMEEVAIARMDLREGELDAHTLYEEMENGKGVLVGVNVNRIDMSLNEIFDIVDIGETITVYRDGEPIMELPVLAKAAINGDDIEIGYTCNGPNEVGGDGLFLYMPANLYVSLYDEPSIYKYAFNVEETYQADMSAYLDNYREETDPDINYLSSKAARDSAIKFRDMIRFVGGLVGAIFGIAGVLNLTNTIITSILIRRHEFATMQSIGMTNKQLTKMMLLEGLCYAAGSCIVSLAVATALNLTLVKGILSSMWTFTFRFTLMPAIATSIILLAISCIIPVLTLRHFYKGSIVEQLRVVQ